MKWEKVSATPAVGSSARPSSARTPGKSSDVAVRISTHSPFLISLSIARLLVWLAGANECTHDPTAHFLCQYLGIQPAARQECLRILELVDPGGLDPDLLEPRLLESLLVLRLGQGAG